MFDERNIPTKKIVPVPSIDGAAIRAAIVAGNVDEWRKKIPSGALDVVMEIVNKQ